MRRYRWQGTHLDASVCACACASVLVSVDVVRGQLTDKSDSDVCLGHVARDVLFSGWAYILHAERLKPFETLGKWMLGMRLPTVQMERNCAPITRRSRSVS